MSLADVHLQISDSLARGTSLDSIIPRYVAVAARWIERNYTMQYMQRFGEFSVDPLAEDARVVELENSRIKSINFVRYIDGPHYQYLRKISPKDQKWVPQGIPDSYWQDGAYNIVLSSIPGSVMSFEIWWIEYSSWPTETTSTHWLIENAFDLLVAQALMGLARRLRDTRMYDMYKNDRDEALRTLELAEDENQFSDQDNRMNYRGEIGRVSAPGLLSSTD